MYTYLHVHVCIHMHIYIYICIHINTIDLDGGEVINVVESYIQILQVRQLVLERRNEGMQRKKERKDSLKT